MEEKTGLGKTTYLSLVVLEKAFDNLDWKKNNEHLKNAEFKVRVGKIYTCIIFNFYRAFHRKIKQLLRA